MPPFVLLLYNNFYYTILYDYSIASVSNISELGSPLNSLCARFPTTHVDTLHSSPHSCVYCTIVTDQTGCFPLYYSEHEYCTLLFTSTFCEILDGRTQGIALKSDVRRLGHVADENRTYCNIFWNRCLKGQYLVQYFALNSNIYGNILRASNLSLQ